MFLKRKKSFWWQINYFLENRYLGYFLIFLICFLVFLYLQKESVFADPDAFYHLKISELISQKGMLLNFKWLPYTILNNYFTDHHFLYHLILAPLVSIFPFSGLKIATILLSSSLVTIIYWFLRKRGVKYAFFFSLLLLFINPFLFRINLVKANSLSLIFLILGINCLLENKKWPLFVLSFLYVWSYGGWQLLPFISGIYCLIYFLNYRHKKIENFLSEVIGRFLKPIKNKSRWNLFFYSLIGCILGVIINPYFPKNLVFYWTQFVEIGVINYQKILNVGQEWYPYAYDSLLAGTGLIILILILGILFYFLYFKKNRIEDHLFLFLSVFFFVATLKSRRYVEYFIPFALIFSALKLSQVISFLNFKKYLISFYRKKRILFIIILIYFSITIPINLYLGFSGTRGQLLSGYDYKMFAQAMNWLKENTVKDEIIIHSSWDEFPMLFYYNDYNQYMAGLDPTFFYKADQEKYNLWSDFTQVKSKKSNKFIIHELKARYVLVSVGHDNLRRELEKDENFQKVYLDKYAAIYKWIGQN